MATSTYSTLFSYDVLERALSERSVLSILPVFCFEQDQVRMVQHKQTRDLYALKYINKPKCVKMKAVANIIQERRLLEEVSPRLTSQPESSTHIYPLYPSPTDRPPLCSQPPICISGR
jgi:hypothetical protein